MFHENAHSLAKIDREVFDLIQKEDTRQNEGIELIASENYTSRAVMEAQGSILTNKYAEGLPHKRYYGGCEFVDGIEQLAIDRVCQLFGAKYANVQPHSGSQANMAAYLTLVNHGDTILGMDLSQGGHLTHGSPVNFSGKQYKVISYGLDLKTEKIDYNHVREVAKANKPKLIVAGASAYSQIIDFKTFREIADEVGALLLVDMAHIAGLVAAGLHPSPIPYAHITTSTTHKTLRGPRGGIILTNDEALAKKMNSQVFPGIQGGPLEHVIAAKAVAFKEALDPSFKTYQQQVINNAKTLATSLREFGADLVSGGTENHLMMMKTDCVQLSGKDSEILLDKSGITCNKNMIPGDTRSPFVTSGIRLGTPAITTRGMKEVEMKQIATHIMNVLKSNNEETCLKTRHEVEILCKKFPVY